MMLALGLEYSINIVKKEVTLRLSRLNMSIVDTCNGGGRGGWGMQEMLG